MQELWKEDTFCGVFFFYLFPYSAEAVQQFPEVLNRNPSEVEEAIYSKSNDKVQQGPLVI